DGKTLASAGFDGAVRFWDPATGTEQAALAAPASAVNALAFSADGKTLAVASNAYSGPEDNPLAGSEDPGVVQLWDVAGRRERLRLAGLTGKVLGLAFSPDGKTLATAGGSWEKFGEVRQWEADGGKAVARLFGPRYWAECVAFSPDGRVLAA